MPHRQTEHAKLPLWPFRLVMAILLFLVAILIWAVVDNVRRLGRAEAAYARYRAAPACLGRPAPGCRATVEGTVERAEIRRVSQRSFRQFLTVQLPGSSQEVEMPRGIINPNAQPYPAFQPRAPVTGEVWDGRVVLLRAGAVVEQTRAHPEGVVERLRGGRITFVGVLALFLATAGLVWWVSRQATRHRED